MFAIAVDSIECWLLPLLVEGKKAAKTTGCSKTANDALAKANEKTLAVPGLAKIRAYSDASKGYRKRKTLDKLRGENPSLELFVKQLDAISGGNGGGEAAAPEPIEKTGETQDGGRAESADTSADE